MTAFPKISIVTPSFNDVAYLEQTILSIINQGYPNLEYIVIDGGSTDGSVDIIEKYADRLAYWVSEKDQGMYHAIQKGFQYSTGEVMGWINSDDIHHPRSLFSIGQIFSDFKEISWLQGFPNSVDEHGRTVIVFSNDGVDKFFYYDKRYRYIKSFIQQESTFWRRSLWNKAGAHVSTEYKYAGDFELWIRFFQHEKLYNVYGLLGSFRVSRSEQASVDHYEEYLKETYQILEKFPLGSQEIRRNRYRKRLEKIESLVARVFGKIRHKLNLHQQTVISSELYFDQKSQCYKSFLRK